jgi:hypothetical protein
VAVAEINFTHQKVIDLRRAYTQAVETEQEIFVFEGHTLLTDYAYYLLEYLEPKFGIRRQPAPGRPNNVRTTTMLTPDELTAGLANFTGTEQWHRHGMFRQMLLTDGVKWLADNAECYWLIDAIGSHIFTTEKLSPRKEPFQVWTLAVNDGKATLRATDGGKHGAQALELVRQEIEYTDFPLPTIEIWAVWDGGFTAFVLLLPSEY